MESIITNDMEHCFICGRPYPQVHHIMNKFDKKRSEKYGLIIPLCIEHHTGSAGVHTKPERMLAMRQLGQREFERRYGHELWMSEFKKSYL